MGLLALPQARSRSNPHISTPLSRRFKFGMSTQDSPWEKIITTSDRFLDLIAPQISNVEEIETTLEQIPPLHLPDVDSQSLRQALSRRTLSKSIIRGIGLSFDKRMEELKDFFSLQWQQLLATTRCTISKLPLDEMKDGFQQIFVKSSKDVEVVILATLDRYLNKFSCDAEAAARSESESSEGGIANPRGHSRLAIAILEKAYSHTTNITRAEKIRLAAITKLQPRQVTIWFQNRRNRKTAVASSKAVEAVESSREDHDPTSSVTSSQTRPGRNKRKRGKIDDDDEEEDQLQSSPQRTRSTSNYSPMSSGNTSLSGSSDVPSMESSTDTLASWSRGVAAKGRNYSSESSVMGNGTPTYRLPGKTPTSISFDDEIQRQIGNSSFASDQSFEEDSSSALLFNDEGAAQLDFDDLGLDLNSLVGDLPSFSRDVFDFSMPTPSACLGEFPSNFHFDFHRTPRKNKFAVPNSPTSPEAAADRLSLSTINVAGQVLKVQQAEKWTGRPVHFNKEDSEEEWYLDLEAFKTGGTSTPGSESNTSSEAVTPPDIFDFSLGGLLINEIMEENFYTFQSVKSKSVRPGDLLLDTNLANRCSLSEGLQIRDDNSQVLARHRS
ncbi:hypothetical protein CBS101457_002620 [Exobasidium rhododendri]|nr:hypothetical protein CBS101457_002620 [Exobasidium rhododendri]